MTFGESDYRCRGKCIADGIMPVYFDLISAANREPSSIVSHCVIRWSEGKLEGLYLCVCVCMCVRACVVCIRALRGEQRERVLSHNEGHDVMRSSHQLY